MSASQASVNAAIRHCGLPSSERAALNGRALADQQHFHQTVATAAGPSFTCGRCQKRLLGSGRYYPGSHLAGQPEMRVCAACEAALCAEVNRVLAAAPICGACGVRKAAFDGKVCWPCRDGFGRAQARAVARVVILPMGFELLARAEKARAMAAVLTKNGITAADAARMTAEDWNRFAAGLREAGVLKPHSTTPSAETIARVISELEAIERAAAQRRASTPRGYAAIAPGIAVRVCRRRAA